MSSTIEDTADSPPDADGWHTDVTWVAEPPAYAVLNAKVIPERGGDTMWASLFAAYDALSPVMQELCCQLTVRHHSGADFHERVGRTMGAGGRRADHDRVPAGRAPAGAHASGHRAAARCSCRVGSWTRSSACAVTRATRCSAFLGRHIENPNFCVRWHWTEGDVAVWDEASTNHRALSDHYPAHRVMRRCTVDGARPYFLAGD